MVRWYIPNKGIFLNLFWNPNSDWSLVPGLFCFMFFVYWKGLGSKENLIILFQNILLSKEFLACNGCFGLFNKIIKRFGTSFCCIFSAWFFCKNVLYLILPLWTKFQCCYFFRSQDIKQNVLSSSYLDNWGVINFKILSSIIL